jgi:hypothetical protein
MRPLALVIMLIALYLLCRIALPKHKDAKQGNVTPQPKNDFDASDLVVKSRFVLPNRSQPQPTRTTPAKSDFQEEKPYIFAAGNENRNSVIPNEKLDEVFGEDVNPEDLDIEPDENEKSDEPKEADEEAEEMRQMLGGETGLAVGWSIEELTEVAEAINHPTDEKADILLRAEKTDMFERLVSGDAGKAAKITAVIDRYVRSQTPEVENEASDSEWNDFDIRNVLSRTVKK